MGDERFHLLHEVELVGLAARQNLRVGARLVIAHRRLLDQLDAPQELHVHVAFPARKQQAHRIAVSRHQPLAVLVERYHRVVQGLAERHAAAQGKRVRALGDQPFRFRVDTSLLQQRGKHHAGPLGAGDEAVQRLHARLDGLRGKQRRAVAAAFDERHARHHRIAPDRVEAEREGPLHQAVDHEAVPVRVDIRRARVHDGEMQPVRRETAVDQVVRSARVRGARLALRIAQGARHLLLEPRALFISGRDRPGREAPRLIRERRGRGGSGDGVAGHHGRERGAAAKKGAAVQQSVARGWEHVFHGVLLSSGGF